MKKLTFLLFGLLLAVGWTSNASAQSAVYKAADMTDWTYQWGDANGVTQTSHYIDPETEQPYQVTDKYQIYGLLKNVYMDKRFPGPLYSAYAPNGTTRQDPVYYGSIAGGWNIPANPAGATTTTNVTFNQNSDYAASTLSKSGVTITNSGGSLAQYNY